MHTTCMCIYIIYMKPIIIYQENFDLLSPDQFHQFPSVVNKYTIIFQNSIHNRSIS